MVIENILKQINTVLLKYTQLTQFAIAIVLKKPNRFCKDLFQFKVKLFNPNALPLNPSKINTIKTTNKQQLNITTTKARDNQCHTRPLGLNSGHKLTTIKREENENHKCVKQKAVGVQ